MMNRKQARAAGCTHVGNFVDFRHTLIDNTVTIITFGNTLRCNVYQQSNKPLRSPIMTMVHLRKNGDYYEVPGTQIKFSAMDGEYFNPARGEGFHPVVLDLNSVTEL